VVVPCWLDKIMGMDECQWNIVVLLDDDVAVN